MLQRLIHINFSVKVSSKSGNLLCLFPPRRGACHQCGSRLYSSHKVSSLRSCYDRTSVRNCLYLSRTRYCTSQVDAQKKAEHIEALKPKASLTSAKKINVKLKTSELKRLLGLAEPEKWKLTGW